MRWLGAFRADILLLDLNLPGEDGISLARRIREVLPEVGIIMVTARRQARDKIEGYGSGADIYLTKPTSVEELDAAIQALSRRVRPAPALVTGRLRLNPATLQLSGPRSTIDVSDQECSLLLEIWVTFIHRPTYNRRLSALVNIQRAQEVSFIRASTACLTS
ncbi:MAG: response regulator transcription factor, partial [Sulfuricellaceae bacterium]